MNAEGDGEPGCASILVWVVGGFSLVLMVAWRIGLG